MYRKNGLVLFNYKQTLIKSIYTKRYTQFRKLIIEARKSANLTQTELSFKLGKPQSYVSKYERGERRLDVIEFLEISDALEIDPIIVMQKLLNQD